MIGRSEPEMSPDIAAGKVTASRIDQAKVSFFARPDANLSTNGISA
jgi:hypothetical protein